MAGLTLVDVCMPHCLRVDCVGECVTAYVTYWANSYRGFVCKNKITKFKKKKKKDVVWK